MKTTKLKLPEKRIFTLYLVTGCFTIIAASFSAHRDNGNIPYPDGYRNWTHVKTALIQKGNPAFEHWGGFHHIYGNAKAIEGYKTGKFEDGSILVFDVLDASSRDSMITEGKRKLIDVMVKDAQAYKNTGGWGYEEFAGDSKTERRIGSLSITACYNCHAHQKINDNVFSKLRN